MSKNFNVGLLGHVDSGKTTLARALSSISSTAAFDKNPQSVDRGITLDLGFSGLLVDAPPNLPQTDKLQFTFVDCPGHASLIRTIIGGAQIIDLMLLVVDAQKGIQTQTAECLVIGELLQKKLIVVINKIDAFATAQREIKLEKLRARLVKTLAATSFGSEVPMYAVSALEGIYIPELRAGLSDAYFQPQRNVSAPLLMYVDHCFGIKGQGTVCTGTLIQGSIQVNDTVELPALGEKRKVKAMQIFRENVSSASMGDRIGLCVTQFNAKLLERGVIAEPGYLKLVFAVCLQLRPIRYYKHVIRSKSKLHITVGHDTVMANITLFQDKEVRSPEFDLGREYEYVEELLPAEMSAYGVVFALLQFESPVLTTLGTTLIASKLDMDAHSNSCRLAFWGHIAWQTQDTNYAQDVLPKLRVFKRKQKVASIQRVVNANEVIVQNLFKKEANRDMYVGKWIELSTGERGCIERTFGQTSKVCIVFREALSDSTIEKFRDLQVLLNCKKYVFNKQAGLFQ
ncbi:selenocysteine-specific elongation factor [Drosophila persimilis]|uniref:Selenocysteine-specific elongation factor n=1 Tax=Drosophila pseudoobscura pseudoobscura TaxID=46245 RepID=A0A6I8UWN5_DROPS|nr:selenocysteine-specific elongation factor [Drosophila pseudoobscura]XP_002026660.2 selenocysteine-specific elongation factor [Drosophila persimilis]